jgi:hypothetical protein
MYVTSSKKPDKYLVVLTLLLVIFTNEFALSAIYLPELVKNFGIISTVFILFTYLAVKDAVKTSTLVLISLIFCLATTSLFVRGILFEDFNLTASARDFYHVTACVILTTATRLVFKSREKLLFSRITVLFIDVVYILGVLSAIAFVVMPITLFSFQLESGKLIHVIYLTLSNSIYSYPGITFARVSIFFDEPGTFGLFSSLLISILYAYYKKLNTRIGFLLVCTLFSLSLSFILFVLFFLAWVWIISLRDKASLKGVVSYVEVRFLIFLFFSVCIYSSLTIFFDNSMFDLTSYLAGRLDSISEGTHNRSEGYEFAKTHIFDEIWGSQEVIFLNREVPGSGLLVMLYYKGWVYISAFITLALGFLWYFKYLLGSGWLYHVPLFVALSIGIGTRNNFFNSSGYVLLLVCAIYVRGLGIDSRVLRALKGRQV